MSKKGAPLFFLCKIIVFFSGTDIIMKVHCDIGEYYDSAK